MSHRDQLKEAILQKKPLTVGAVADLETLSLPPQDCDIVELRLDSLGYGPEVLNYAKNSPLPLLITARGTEEGGQANWSIDDRISAYQALMPYASLIDIELRDLSPLSKIITLARESGVLVIGSFHDFEKTPPHDSLTAKLNKAQVDIHKFALMAHTSDDIQSQLSLTETLRDQNISVMGMGPLGAAARPLMAKAGSLLNYGYLGKTPTAPNQWPASLLKEALSV